jgi:hypothetical protein
MNIYRNPTHDKIPYPSLIQRSNDSFYASGFHPLLLPAIRQKQTGKSHLEIRIADWSPQTFP